MVSFSFIPQISILFTFMVQRRANVEPVNASDVMSKYCVSKEKLQLCYTIGKYMESSIAQSFFNPLGQGLMARVHRI